MIGAPLVAALAVAGTVSAGAVSAAAVSAGAQTPGSRPTSALRGTIVDARIGQPIGDARVTLVGQGRSVTTAADGRFAFEPLPPGRYAFTVTTIGFIFVRRTVDLESNMVVDVTVPLTEGTGAYQETVTVTADLTPPRTIGTSSEISLGSAALAELRGVANDDPLRALQALPGVATGDDFQAEFSVRGSAFRHVGIVIDGTPTSTLVHAVRGVDDTGSIAMINTDILASASLSAGPHVLRHGDWLGATLDFGVRDGSRDRAGARVAAGGTNAAAVFEGPIGGDRRGAWLVSMRKSYLDWLIRKLEPGIDSTLGFMDGQAKVVYDVTPRQQIQFVALGGRAVYRKEQASIANGLVRATSSSGVLSAAWRYVRGPAVFTQRASYVGSDFGNRGMVGQELGRGYTHSVSWRADVFAGVGGWTIEAGGRRERMRASHILRDFAVVTGTTLRVRNERQSAAVWTQTGGWAHASRRFGALGLAFGARGATRTIASRGAVSPWGMVELAQGRVVWRASAGASAQYPDPLFIGADGRDVRPERARSADAGLELKLAGGWSAQTTGFARVERGVMRIGGEPRIDAATGRRVLEAVFPEIAPTLDGDSRGADLVVSRRAQRGPTGWVAYTWALTRYRDRVTGERFAGDFDQRHTVNVVAEQRLSYRMVVHGKLRMGSNFPVTGYFGGELPALTLSALRNQVRLPRYLRLDLKVVRTFTFDRRRLTLFVEVMNATGRQNYGLADGSIRSNLDAVGYVERLIPRVPSAGILIEF